MNYIEEETNSFITLRTLYNLLGINLTVKSEKILVSSCLTESNIRISELFSIESWLKTRYLDVYNTYTSAIDTYLQGHAGLCIESCRTCLVSIFSKFKGTDAFAKWIRGIFNTNENLNNNYPEEIKPAIDDLNKKDLFDFFNENKDGKLTKTKTIYMIYSMMSDYGTHRNESQIEIPKIEDALFCLRLTDSILFWLYSKTN